jgi:hypothetical protein
LLYSPDHPIRLSLITVILEFVHVYRRCDTSLTRHQVNVALPPVPDPEDVDEHFHQLKYFEEGFFEANCFAAAVRGVPLSQSPPEISAAGADHREDSRLVLRVSGERSWLM